MTTGTIAATTSGVYLAFYQKLYYRFDIWSHVTIFIPGPSKQGHE